MFCTCVALSSLVIINYRQRNTKVRHIVFAGNSLTHYFPLKEILRDERIKNFGVPGATIEGLIGRCDTFLALDPEKIFIEIGINNLHQGDSCKQVLNHYQTLIQRIRAKCPDANIYVQSLLPSNIKTKNGLLELNAQSRKMNLLLKDLCEKEKTIFINLYPVFEDHGKLKEEFDVGDGLHLTAAAYFAWKEQIEKYLK